MDLFFGHVTEIYDPKKFIIKFTRKGDIEDAIAYPIDTFDEPNIGDPVVIFEIESIFGQSFMWQKQRLFDHTRVKFGSSTIDLNSDGIEMTTEDGKFIEISSDGDISISGNDDMEVTVSKNMDIEIGGNATIKVTGNVKLECATLDMSGVGSGTVVPIFRGGIFNAIPICPYTGQPHGGNKIM